MSTPITKRFFVSLRRLLLLTVMLYTGIVLSGQDTKVVSDLHLWTGVSVEKSFEKDWTIFLAEEIRFKHDMSVLNNHFTETGLRYRINKNFALEGQYRVTFDKKKDNSYDQLSRIALDLRYKGRLDFITILYRFRFQKEVKGWNLFDQEALFQKYVRNRIRIRYNDFKIFKPYLSAELFQLFEPYQTARYEYVRILGGIRYIHHEFGVIDLAYGVNLELIETQPATIYTIKVNYTYRF